MVLPEDFNANNITFEIVLVPPGKQTQLRIPIDHKEVGVNISTVDR